MAQGGQPRPVQDGEQEYAFRSVELYKTETLGTGSYGAVCKAKCDELICAAKLLYPVLFEMQPQAPEPGKEHRQPFRRFEVECRFLSRINHPNIVQYLGTYRDPDTNAPVLLMELMDESLTHFLDSSPGLIPYHVQVNLCYDIAQALAFLHSNGIIHRDLSSNNVLLIAGSRAKVTDFGMAKFADIAATRLATMTTCPGTPAYMSPEALNEPPVYTEKLDNFSLGVVIVQIVTRKFPKPTDRFQIVQIVDPRSLNRTVRAQLPVPEVERRHAHISLVDPTHPLLPIALHCLKDEDVERPSSQQLCQTLGALKETATYEESSQQDKDQLLRAKDEQILTQTQEIVDKTHQLEAKVEDIVAKETEIHQLAERLEQATRDNLVLQHEAKDEQILTRTDKTHQLEAKVEDINAKEIENSQLAERLEQSCQDTLVLHHEAEAKEGQLRRLNQQVESNEEIAAALRHTITQKEREMSELQRVLSSKDDQIRDISSRLERVDLRDWQSIVRKTQTNQMRINLVRCEALPDAPMDIPMDISGGSSAMVGNVAYFNSGRNHTVYEYNSCNQQWSTVANNPNVDFTMVCVHGTLTSVGGRPFRWAGVWWSNKLYSLLNRKWVEHFPPMPTRRENPAAVYTNNILVVAGGLTIQSVATDAVEVLATEMKQWSSVSSLSWLMYKVSKVPVVCKDIIYIATNKHAVWKCSVTSLVQSKPESDIWEKMVLPVRESSLATLNGNLLAIGGKDADNKETQNIHRYDPATNSWEVVSKMLVPRSQCLTAVLPDNTLMVVGGYPDNLKAAEIVTFNWCL